jgi:hypothetical protein
LKKGKRFLMIWGKYKGIPPQYFTLFYRQNA